jgi:zearalenone synthase (nonreducing iterative type I polyketide synthase)
VCDGTGSISNYIHLLKNQFPLAVYGIDSPFLRCPSRFTPEVGIPGAAKYMVEALIKAQPNAGLSEPILIGGFSGGALFSYEMCRQLTDQGRRVDGLVVLDMRSPLQPPPNLTSTVFPSLSDEPVWEILFTTAQDSMAGQIHGSNADTNTTKHLRTMFKCVLGYHPPRREAAGSVFDIPAVVIWCSKGMIGRLEARRPDLVTKLDELGYPVESYPGYMEDPRLGAMAWSIPHKRTESDLGPGGWENFVGGGGVGESLLCLAVDADHHDVLHPTTAPKTSALIDQGVAFLLGRMTPNK